MATDLAAAREFMQSAGIAGWLTRDYRYTNPIFFAALGWRPGHLTRPVWLWIPSDDEPKIFAHDVDVHRFGDIDIPVLEYSNRGQMTERLRTALPANGGDVAMEYSPMYELPRVARVDAGSVELVRSFGLVVVSSGDVSQYATERWSAAQLESHRYAMGELLDGVKEAFNFVGENVRWKLTEHDVAEFIRGKYERSGIMADDGPCVAFNANSSDPHYEPTVEASQVIRREGWLLIDTWAKIDPKSDYAPEMDYASFEPVYADITWVAKIGSPATQEHETVFNAVKDGRDVALEFIRKSHARGDFIQGWQADRVARETIAKTGYGEYFVHRLGHSLGTEVHSNAVNLDDWETHDTRSLIPGIGVTIEPGIYLPHFGVRSEINIHVNEREVEVTGEIENEIWHIET